MNNQAKMPLGRLGIILIIICLLITVLWLYPINDDTRSGHEYIGVDCIINFTVNISLSKVSEILDNHGFSFRIWYNRSSPEGTEEIIDYIYFSYSYSSQKNVSGYIYNFDTDNLTIKLHYYPDEIISYFDKSAEEVENLTHSQYVSDRNNFEPDVDYIISIISSEFNSNPISVEYVQIIRHFIIS